MTVAQPVHSQPESLVLVCCNCKRVKRGNGRWIPWPEAAERLGEEVLISHGICLECSEELYADTIDLTGLALLKTGA